MVFWALCSPGTCSLRAAFSSLYPRNNQDKNEITHHSKDHLFLFDWDVVFELEGIIKRQKERLSHRKASVLPPPSVPLFCLSVSLPPFLAVSLPLLTFILSDVPPPPQLVEQHVEPEAFFLHPAVTEVPL